MSNTPRIDRNDKNFLINGAGEFSKRAATSGLSSSFGYFAVDRWEMKYTGSWSGTSTESSSTLLGDYTDTSIYLAGTPAALSDDFVVRQKIEASRARELINDVFSFKFLYKTNNFTSVDVKFYTADVEDDFSAVTQLGSTQTKTLLDDSSNQEIKVEGFNSSAAVARGLMVEMTFNGLSAVSATNIYLGELKINIGDKAQEFSRCGRTKEEEEKLCFRYCYQWNVTKKMNARDSKMDELLAAENELEGLGA